MASATIAAENPPKNAADLYRKAIEIYQPDQKTRNTIYDLLRGENEDYQTVEEHIRANQKVIDIAIEASKIKNCDWDFKLAAYDPADPNVFGKEFEYQVDNHSAMKQLVKLILTDAKIHANRFETKKAIDKVIAAYSMDRHMYSDSIIGWLMMIATESQVNQLLHEILSEHQLNISMLNYIERHLKRHINTRQPFTKTFDFETQYELATLSKATLESMEEGYGIREFFDDPNIIDQIVESDNCEYTVFDQNYFLKHQQELRNAINMPYLKAVNVFEKLDNDLSVDAVKFGQPNFKTPEHYTAFMMEVISSSSLWSYLYSSDIRIKTRFNALLTAIEIYKIKAKTGKLSDKIPADSPKDLFSGKDFAYEKTDTGFTLRCQAKDLSKDTIHEYEFKVAN